MLLSLLLMDEPTIPLGEPELMRTSEFQRYLDELALLPPIAGTDRTLLASLSPSLLADLERFEDRPNGTEALEVLAACLRHSQSVVVHLGSGEYVLPLTIFPIERLFHSPAEPGAYLLDRLGILKVLRVEHAILRPPGDPEKRLVAPLDCYYPIGPLLWAMAMRGSRTDLLPEIGGIACYRVTPSLDVRSVPMEPLHRALIRNMREQPMTLREIVEISGQGEEGVNRLLNALYLQSGLIISRALPLSVGDLWRTGLGRRRRDR